MHQLTEGDWWSEYRSGFNIIDRWIDTTLLIPLLRGNAITHKTNTTCIKYTHRGREREREIFFWFLKKLSLFNNLPFKHRQKKTIDYTAIISSVGHVGKQPSPLSQLPLHLFQHTIPVLPFTLFIPQMNPQVLTNIRYKQAINKTTNIVQNGFYRQWIHHTRHGATLLNTAFCFKRFTQTTIFSTLSMFSYRTFILAIRPGLRPYVCKTFR